MSNYRQTALAALLKLRGQVEKGTQDPCGICANSAMLFIDDVFLAGLFRRWPEYSGCSSYPVPYIGRNPERGYWGRPRGYGDAARDYVWGDNPYGQARRRLLDFCIAELQRELAPPMTSKSYKPAHGGYPDANHDAIKVTTPTTCCPCGQVPVCHGLRSCGKSSA